MPPKVCQSIEKISSHILDCTQTPYSLHIVPNMCDITYNMPCSPKYAKVSKDIFYILDYTQTPYRVHIVPNMCGITYNMPYSLKYAKVSKKCFTHPRSQTDSIWTPHSPK